MTTTIVFPAPDRRLSMNDRLCWQAQKRIRDEWLNASYVWTWNAISHGLKRPQPPSRIKVVFEVKKPGVRRDPHNMAPTVKAIVDGMVKAGLFPDDSSQYVTIDDPEFRKGDGVRVELTERT